MNKKFIFSFLILGILILTVGTVSAGFFQDLFSSPTGNAVVGPDDVDKTPRISSWWGKVNQHTEDGVWKTDPDGKSGALLTLTKSGKINYCQKWYPETVDVEEYAEEYIIFYNAGNRGESPSVRTSYECVQSEGSDTENESYCAGDTCIIYEGSSVEWGRKKINILYLDEEGYVKFQVGDIVTDSMQMFESQELENGIKIRVSKVTFVGGENPFGVVEIKLEEIPVPSDYCTDSDGGLDYYEKGYVSDPEHGGNYTDSCIGSTKTLTEYYCGENNYQYKNYECQNGCSDGACIKDSETETPYCGDGICSRNETCSTCSSDCGECETSDSEVTYQGVLDMLNSCEIWSNSGGTSGDSICKSVGKNCVFSMQRHKKIGTEDYQSMLRSCSEIVPISNSEYSFDFSAICCSPPN